MMDVAETGSFLDRAQHDLFRLETLDAYDVASDGGDFRRYVHGEPGPDPERKGPWLRRLAEDKARGLRRRRVHVWRSPIGAYLRYECEWGYAPNAQAGEEIRVLDLAEMASPLPATDVGSTFGDFWVVDSQDVVLMHYTPTGAFLGAAVLTGPAVASYRAAQRVLWGGARDFGSWWKDHPHCHRPAGRPPDIAVRGDHGHRAGLALPYPS